MGIDYYIELGGIDMSDKVKRVMDSLSEILELPKDVMLDLPKLTLVGNIQLYIENHKGIVEYSPQKIRVNSSLGIIKISGKKLQINEVKIEDLIITGKIDNIELSS